MTAAADESLEMLHCIHYQCKFNVWIAVFIILITTFLGLNLDWLKIG